MERYFKWNHSLCTAGTLKEPHMGMSHVFVLNSSFLKTGLITLLQYTFIWDKAYQPEQDSPFESREHF